MEVTTEQKPENSHTTNQAFLKYLVIGLFIILPFVGFYIGREYQKNSTQEDREIIIERPAEVTQPIVDNKESEQDLIERCGDIPPYSKLSINQTDRFTQVSGPMWSSDCRHIAYAIWQSGTSAPDMEPPIQTTGEHDFEGLFLYSDKTGKVEKIYQPNPGETTEFIEWKDSNAILFKTDGETQQAYDILTETVVTPSE